MTALVSVKNVSKTYTRGKQRVEVLRRLNLDVEPGEFLALMGPSGSGKSTLLNLIGGLDRPTSGDIVVGGEHIDKFTNSQLAKWRARRVGFVFQFYHLMPMLTALQNVELPLLLTGLSRARRRQHVETALRLVGLEDRGSHKPSELSGGQQQRVAIARALVVDPEIFVCDEPTGDLDRATAVEILDLMRTLNRQQRKTIIMVTHDPKTAEYATRQVHLDKGQLMDTELGAVA